MNINEVAHTLGYCCPLTMLDALNRVDPPLIHLAFGIPPATFRRWKRQYRRGELLCKNRLSCRRHKESLNGL